MGRRGGGQADRGADGAATPTMRCGCWRANCSANRSTRERPSRWKRDWNTRMRRCGCSAFDGLRQHAGPNDLRPLALALKADKADVGVKAVQALESLAGKDDQAMARLIGALQSNVAEVRQRHWTSLEKVHGKDSPEASLSALGTPHADLRRLALLRLFQRRLLHDPRVQAALRWRGDDPDTEVRRVAFLLSLHTREKLLAALRERDPAELASPIDANWKRAREEGKAGRLRPLGPARLRPEVTSNPPMTQPLSRRRPDAVAARRPPAASHEHLPPRSTSAETWPSLRRLPAAPFRPALRSQPISEPRARPRGPCRSLPRAGRPRRPPRRRPPALAAV